jgi:hypothetical protein
LELGFEEGPDDEAQETNGEQIIAILKEYEAGMKTADLCRKHGIWPAPGSEDTELGVLMEPEVGHGETEVYAGVQA